MLFSIDEDGKLDFDEKKKIFSDFVIISDQLELY